MKKTLFILGSSLILMTACNQQKESVAGPSDNDSVVISFKVAKKAHDSMMERKKAFPTAGACKLTDAQINTAKADYITWVASDAPNNTFTHLTFDMGAMAELVSDYSAMNLEPVVLNHEVTLLVRGYDKNGMMTLCAPLDNVFGTDPNPTLKTHIFCPPPANCALIPLSKADTNNSDSTKSK